MHIKFENCCSRCKTAKTNKQNTNKDSTTRFKRAQIKYSGMIASRGDTREVTIAEENLLTAQNLQTKSRSCPTYLRAASYQNLGNNRKTQS